MTYRLYRWFALKELLYSASASEQYRTELKVNAYKRHQQVSVVCQSCLIEDAMVSRLIYKAVGRKEDYEFYASGTLAQLRNMRNICQTQRCDVRVVIDPYQLATDVTLSSPPETSDIQPKLIADQKKLCFLLKATSPCISCLPRAVPNWSMKYSSTILLPNYEFKIVLAVFFAEQYVEARFKKCFLSFCRKQLLKLDNLACDRVTIWNTPKKVDDVGTRMSTISNSLLPPKKRKRTESDTNDLHAADIAPADHHVTKKPKLVSAETATSSSFSSMDSIQNSLTSHPNAFVCSDIRGTASLMSKCILCIVKKSSASFVIAYQHLSEAKAHLLMHNGTCIIKDWEKKCRTCISMEMVDLNKCHVASAQLYEYPIQAKHSLQRQTICAGAESTISKRDDCLKLLKNSEKSAKYTSDKTFSSEIPETSAWYTSDRSFLLEMKLQSTSNTKNVLSEYERQVDILLDKSRYDTNKCAVIMYSAEACSLHEAIRDIKLDTKNKTHFINPLAKPSQHDYTLWPPCDSASNSILDPFERNFAAVRLSIKGNEKQRKKCFHCISKRLEIFFIDSIQQYYVWMTQVPVADVYDCIKDSCTLEGTLLHCTKHVPFPHPLPILSTGINERLWQHIIGTSTDDDGTALQ